MLGVLIALPGISRDFTYKYQGQTLTYTVLDEEAKTCKTNDGWWHTAGNDVSGEVIIPSVAKDGDIEYTVTELGSKAFYKASVSSVVIPPTVISIGKDAFEGCGPIRAALPSGLTSPFSPRRYDSNYVEYLIQYPREGAIIEDGFLYGPGKETIYFAPRSLKGECVVSDSVTTIGAEAFACCYGLTSLILPNSVISIGNDAFTKCSTLTSVTFSDSLSSIGSAAFYDCYALTSVILPPRVKYIGAKAFDSCYGLIKSAYPNTLSNPFFYGYNNYGLVLTYNPDNDVTIEDNWIYEAGKTAIIYAPITLEGNVNIPAAVNFIDEAAFALCTGLNSITLESTTPPKIYDDSFENLYDTVELSVPDDAVSKYMATNWSLFKNLRLADTGIVTKTFSDGVLTYRLIPSADDSKNNMAMVVPGDYSGLTEVMIPERFTDDSATEPLRYYVDGVGFGAFRDCQNLTSVTFHNRNTSKIIGDYAFAGTGISTITIPETTESIGNFSFSGCKTLKTMEIPANVKSIGNHAFNNCSTLSDVTMNDGLKSIGNYAFSACKAIDSISVPGSVENMGDYAFNNCSSLSGVTLKEGLSSVGNYAFNNCSSLSRVTMNDGLKSIGNYAFSACPAIDSISVPGSVESIGDYAFYNTSGLKHLNLNEGLVSIGESAFASDWRRSAEPLYMPSSLERVGSRAFENFECSKVEISDLSAWLGISFMQAYGNPLYNSHELWLNGEKITNLIIPEEVEEIKPFAFYGCTSVDSVTIGKDVKSIGKSAFCYNSNIRSVIFNDALQSIADYAFYNCNAIRTLILPNSLSTIGQQAFYGEKSLKNLTIGTSLTECNADSFGGCNFDNLIITDGLTGLRFSGEWDKMGIYNLYMGRPIEFVTSEN